MTLEVVLIFIQFHCKCCFPQSTRNKMDSQQHLQLWLWWKLRPCVSANFISHFWDFSLAAIFGTLTFLSHQYFELEYSSGTNIQLKQDAKVPAERSASPKRIFRRKKSLTIWERNQMRVFFFKNHEKVKEDIWSGRYLCSTERGGSWNELPVSGLLFLTFLFKIIEVPRKMYIFDYCPPIPPKRTAWSSFSVLS